MKISSYIIVFIVRGCFDRTHDLNINYFGLDARALLLYNYYNFHLELNASLCDMLKLRCGAVRDGKHMQPFVKILVEGRNYFFKSKSSLALTS